MMKNFLLSVLFLFSTQTHAQVLDTLPWAPKGATWVYFGTYLRNFIEKEIYTKDTLISGRTYKKFLNERTYLASNNNPTPYSETRDYLMYNKNDSIFRIFNGDTTLVYVFKPIVGTSWDFILSVDSNKLNQ